jgi:hypothetical protein
MSGQEDLVTEVVKDMVRRLRETSTMNEELIRQIMSLFEQGKLNDAAALQTALRGVVKTSNENS